MKSKRILNAIFRKSNEKDGKGISHFHFQTPNMKMEFGVGNLEIFDLSLSILPFEVSAHHLIFFVSFPFPATE